MSTRCARNARSLLLVFLFEERVIGKCAKGFLPDDRPDQQTAIAGPLIGAAGGFFFGPIVAVVVAVILVVLVTILIALLVNWIIGGLAFYWKHRKRFIAATYA